MAHVNRYVATARRLPDGRMSVTVVNEAPEFRCDKTTWTWSRVGNIDGSAHFMEDGGGWTFLPHGNAAFCEAVYAAEAALISREQQLG